MANRFLTYKKNIIDETGLTIGANSDAVNIEFHFGYSVYASWVNEAPSAKTFTDGDVDTSSEEIIISSHGYSTGLKLQLTTSGTLPAGLALATDYFVISIDSDTIKLASSLANALAGVPVDITAAAGGGTHTATPYALNGTIELQGSIDGENFKIISGTSTSLTSTGSILFNISDAFYRFVRVVVVQSAGQITVATHLHAKG